MGLKAHLKAILSNRLVIVTCSFILIMNVFFYFFFVRAQQDNIARLEKQYCLMRKRRVAKGANRIQGILQARRSLDAFMAAVVEESAFPQLVHELYGLVQKNGLVTSKMVFKPQQVGHLSLTRYATSFKITGTYSQIKHFLAELLGSRSLFCIDGFVLERNRQGRKVTMTLRLSMYLK